MNEMNSKVIKTCKILFFAVSIILCSILIYFIIPLIIQGIMLSLLLTFVLVSCIFTNLLIIIPKPPKELKVLSFEDEHLILIDIDGWDGQAIKITKDFYKEFLKEGVLPKELDIEISKRLFGTGERKRDGVYILQSRDVIKNKDLIYIGETNDFKRRMYEHEKSGIWDWVQHIFFFTSSKENFGITIRRKIEILLIKMTIRNKNFIVKNSILDSKENLGIAKLYSTFKIIENIKFILRHFELNLVG